MFAPLGAKLTLARLTLSKFRVLPSLAFLSTLAAVFIVAMIWALSAELLRVVGVQADQALRNAVAAHGLQLDLQSILRGVAATVVVLLERVAEVASAHGHAQAVFLLLDVDLRDPLQNLHVFVVRLFVAAVGRLTLLVVLLHGDEVLIFIQDVDLVVLSRVDLLLAPVFVIIATRLLLNILHPIPCLSLCSLHLLPLLLRLLLGEVAVELLLLQLLLEVDVEVCPQVLGFADPVQLLSALLM